jgi:bifunctional UDP-N-acetylglucosamine pyrophosphorylase/glucosamine-1-phosphate N-acetyltransferase/UDP-N-acetylglucosamine pyrophosphorylase
MGTLLHEDSHEGEFMSDAVAVVLAAGKGTRMKSELPKVLVPACGRALIDYVIDSLDAAGIQRKLIVVGYRANDVRTALSSRTELTFVLQEQQLGTGHAVQMCSPQLQHHEGPVVVVTGDSPFLQPDSLRQLLDDFGKDRPACVMGTLIKDSPTGLGRIVRDEQGTFVGIVEEKDTTAEQRLIREVNMSTYVFDCQSLLWALSQLRQNNNQNELYITDCPGIMKSAGKIVRALPLLKPCEAISVNNFDDLAAVETEIRRQGLLK